MYELVTTQSVIARNSNRVMIGMQPSLASSPEQPARKLELAAWAVFFIWVGISMLAEVPWGWFLLGVGTLILATQSARWLFGMKIEGFWAVCGAVLLAGGVWKILDLPWPLAPILLILLGLALLGNAAVGARS
jgi:hypothetical protein